MERIEYFAQEIKQKEAKEKADEAEVRINKLMVRDPIVWRNTYEAIAANAWRAFDIATIGI